MKITDALYGEHRQFYAYMEFLDGLLDGNEAPSLEALRALAGGFEHLIMSHAKIEEDGLFRALEGELGGMGPLEVILGEHREIDRLAAAAKDADTAAACAGQLGDLMSLLRQHFMKEERVLFVLAQQHLGEDALSALGDAWAETRTVTVGGPDAVPGCG